MINSDLAVAVVMRLLVYLDGFFVSAELSWHLS